MKCLLDTHVWLWMGTDSDRLGEQSRATLDDPKNELYLSIASVWEMVVKNGLGKLDLPLDVQSFVRKLLPASQSTLLNLTLEHVFALRSLPDHHRDPFDRMIVAQALVEGMRLVTADPRVLGYPISTLDARQ